jgi:hypothetical protein
MIRLVSCWPDSVISVVQLDPTRMKAYVASLDYWGLSYQP